MGAYPAGVLGLRPASDLRVRLPRLVSGVVLAGIGIGAMVRADLGLPPWSVLDHGISKHTGIPIGTVGILVGAVVLMTWIVLRERPGLGTVLNILVIGVTTDVFLAVVPETTYGPSQAAYVIFGALIWGPGSGLYIGAGLGPGPRDGLMTALSARGVGSIRVVRTALELTALIVGWLLGGRVGIGTVLFACTIGPNVQFFLQRLSLPVATPPPAPAPAAAA